MQYNNNPVVCRNVLGMLATLQWEKQVITRRAVKSHFTRGYLLNLKASLAVFIRKFHHKTENTL